MTRPSERRGRSRRRRKIAIAASVVIAITFGGYAVAHSSLFGITGIDVTGTTRTSEVVDASGLHVGENVLGLDLRATDARVQALPWVETARTFRAGTLGVRIDIIERHAVMELRDGLTKTFVDENGVPARPATPTARLPIVDVKASSHVGGTRDAAELVHVAIAFWRALPKGIVARIGSITVGAGDAITFVADGIRVNFGGPDRVAEKLRALTLVEERVARAGRKLVAIDVRAPAHPAARIH